MRDGGTRLVSGMTVRVQSRDSPATMCPEAHCRASTFGPGLSAERVRRLTLRVASVAVVMHCCRLTELVVLMDQVQISLLVTCSGLDADGVADLTAELRREILETGVDGAELASAGKAPEGAKSGALVAVGALAVTLAPTVVQSLMDVISSWLSRQPDDVEIEIDGNRFQGRVSEAQRDDLVAAYLRRVDNEP
jgi:hypothetical protein